MPRQTRLFEVHDPIELLALWRLVAEAKFHHDPEDTDLWGSPYVHQLAQRLSNALLHAARLSGDADGVLRHERWVKSLASNVVLDSVKAHLKQDALTPEWRKRTAQEKIAHVNGCIAPFEASTEFIEGLILEAEA